MTILLVLARLPVQTRLLALLLAQSAARTTAQPVMAELGQGLARALALRAELEPAVPELEPLVLVEPMRKLRPPQQLHRRPLHSRAHPRCPPHLPRRPRTPVSRKSPRP